MPAPALDLEPLRVALCITELDPGGAERCMVALAKGLNRERFSPVVYCLAGPPAPRPESLLRELEAAGIETHCLGARGLRSAWGAVRQLAALLRRQRADVVQSFLFHANLAARIAARRAGRPPVLAGIRVAECDRPWRLRLDRWTAGLVHRYVCVSRSVADFHAQTVGIPADRIVVIPNAVDCDRFADAQPMDLGELGVAAGQRAVVFVGRLHEQKGLVAFLAHAREWLDRLPGHDLILVGDGPQAVALRQQSCDLGLASRVHFAGWRPDVSAVLKASDLLVLPSRWEGMPNAVLEAMAAGLPVAAFDVEGVSELLGPQAAAQTVSPGELPQLAGLMATILSSPDLARQLGAQNQNRARNQFSVSAMVQAYERLFASVRRGL